ncbi:pentatricopeptide repeat-containing protein At5g39350-like [Triticum dicoccoides]|uniref:pentatricopeptide repeat-containing protein At5g39350-like n=1 Tax=Triticum dicoccoides TaxID=85692 RepID=UPI001890FB95|nr:pentatricopeptide repeat-containing protein At5g39350-like [Triticum dicoccoides]
MILLPSPLVRQCLALLHSKNAIPLAPTTTAQLHALPLTSGHLIYSSIHPLFMLHRASGRPSDAHNLLAQMPHPPPVSLTNSLLRSYTGLGHHKEAVALYSRMRGFDHLTFPLAAKACAGLRLGRHGRAVHCRSLAAGFGGDAYVQNALISMYMSCGDVAEAEAVFRAMQNRSVVSWNAVIAGCVKNGCAERALEVFGEMVGDGAGVDRATIVSVLPACARTKNLSIGRAVHRLVEERGLGDYAAVKNALIDMYGKCGRLEDACRVFDGHKYDKNVVSWTVMIGAYVLNDRVDEAFNLGFDMLMTGGAPWPNGVTMAYLLSACSSLPSWRRAKCTHAMCIRLGLESDIVVETALIDTYAKCHKMKMMELTLENGSRRTETWNAAISGYSRSEREKKAVELFKRMIGESVRPDSATLASILPAYGESADLRQARNIHCYLLTLGFLRSTSITTGLVDVYAKAGDLDMAWALFDGLPEKDVVAWTTILAGYGMHGHARTAILLYEQMVELAVKPNTVTFTSLLYACSHAGLIDEGLQLFEDMRSIHGVVPNVEHYLSLIDMIGRAGRIKEAYRFIKDMPFEPSTSVWGVLLGACVLHKNVEFGEIAAKHLFELEPENTGNRVLLGNIYAAADRWNDVQDIRKMMGREGLIKEPGSSLVEARSEQCRTAML